MESNLTGNDIIKIIKEAKKSDVSKIEVSPDGNIKIEFNRSEKPEVLDKFIKNDTAMDQVARESEDEDDFNLTQDLIDDWEINCPEEIDKHISHGNIIQQPDGSLEPAR